MEDELGERTEEQNSLEEEEIRCSSVDQSHLEAGGSPGSKMPSRREEGDQSTSECTEVLTSGEATPVLAGKEEMRSGATTPDSGCNMSQSY